jgi:histidinol dehydrogenase
MAPDAAAADRAQDHARMLTRIDLRGDRSDPTDRLPRASAATIEGTRATVRDVLAAVRADGDDAILRYAAEFDGWDGDGGLEVPLAEAQAALAALDPDLRAALERAADQVRWFHEKALPHDWVEERDGARMGVTHRPLRRVGVYVPGGLGAYPSTVIMTVVPAKVAGVDEVVLCTPPGADGQVNRTILAAAALTGADRILRVGGAQAVGAMAYGTASVPRCDKVVGPGNRFVAEAKQQVAADGACGIDAMAGVTEVAIIADDTADPVHVAADLVAQAEHDPLATCLLITASEALLERVEAALVTEVDATRHSERVAIALKGQGAVALVDDLDQAVAVADAFAAEHLEIQTADAREVAGRIRAAGAIFVGANTPVSLGDYCAGPNHTLPTAGTARFTGGLRTDDFMVPINVVEYTAEALADLAPVVEALGAAEDLPAHVRAVRARLEPR